MASAHRKFIAREEGDQLRDKAGGRLVHVIADGNDIVGTVRIFAVVRIPRVQRVAQEQQHIPEVNDAVLIHVDGGGVDAVPVARQVPQCRKNVEKIANAVAVQIAAANLGAAAVGIAQQNRRGAEHIQPVRLQRKVNAPCRGGNALLVQIAAVEAVDTRRGGVKRKAHGAHRGCDRFAVQAADAPDRVIGVQCAPRDAAPLGGFAGNTARLSGASAARSTMSKFFATAAKLSAFAAASLAASSVGA